MTKIYAVLTTIILVFAVSSAYALDPEPIFDLQDDFEIIFGEVNNPISAGTVLNADGRLLFAGTNQIAAWFRIINAVSTTGEDLADENMWKLNFISGTFDIRTGKNGGGDLIWEGEITNFSFIYSKDYSLFVIPAEFMPAADVQLYQGYGSAVFTRPALIPATDLWDVESIYLTKMGAYNMNEILVNPRDPSSDLKGLIGNMQGTLVIPEPGTLAAMLTGLAGLGIAGVRRIKK
ncbi:MAG: PEP-CTERM sorting domain-containing protein [Armatimonadota bacterium]